MESLTGPVREKKYDLILLTGENPAYQKVSNLPSEFLTALRKHYRQIEPREQYRQYVPRSED